MRCLSLAEVLAERGAEILFVCRDLPGHLAERIAQRQFAVALLPLLQPCRTPATVDDYAGRLQVSEADDAGSFLAALPGHCDLVVVDHYGLGQEWERQAARHCDTLVVIDDLCRLHHASFVIDQTFGREPSAYASRAIGCALTGSHYALLQPVYYQLREQIDRSILPGEHRLLVSMGGFDPLNVTGEVVDLLVADAFGWLERVDVVLSTVAPHYEHLRQRISELGERFCLHDVGTGFAELMAQSTLSVGAPGTTTWERAALGLPSVLIPFAENQIDNATAMQAAGAAVVVTRPVIGAELRTALESLRDKWPDYVQANRIISDGLGCRRVLQRICPALNKGAPVWLAKAGVDDIRQVHDWQQMPETRRYARNRERPGWDEHNQWMRSRLNDPGCYFYLLRRADVAVGVVRLDRLSAGEYEVSIFMAPDTYGQGLGKLALALLGELHREITIHATVLPDNAASLRLFLSAGYQRISETEFILPKRT